MVDATFSMAKELFLRCGDLRRSGSAAVDLCRVAAGRCDGFFELCLSPWDYAAGAVILQEAGAVIGTLPGQPFPLRPEAGHSGGNQNPLSPAGAACREISVSAIKSP